MPPMLQIFDALLTALACVLAAPTLVFFAQVMAAQLPPTRESSASRAARRRIAVLVPAHDEETGIATTLNGLRSQMAPTDRLLVVADNCSDATAAVALANGAEVVVRTDALLRGKGYALDHGMRHLRADPPDIVVIVDADCDLHTGSLDALADRCIDSGRPVQALYLMRAPASSGLRTRVSEFAWIVKNRVRPLGMRRLGLPCQLMGTGMAFPWTLLQHATLASGNIVEDLQLGLDLAESGRPPLFCPDALVTSAFPASAEGLSAQRTRWEHGHIATLLTHGPRLIWRGIRQRRIGLLALALDLCVPPLASLALALVVLLVLTTLFGLAIGAWRAAAVNCVAVALLVIGVLAAWRQYGRSAVSMRELLSAPWYVVAKLPMYAQLLLRRQTRWVRTKRDDRG